MVSRWRSEGDAIVVEYLPASSRQLNSLSTAVLTQSPTPIAALMFAVNGDLPDERVMFLLSTIHCIIAV